MNKILITIYVVSIDEEFDLFLPIGVKMQEALNLIQDSIHDLSKGNYLKRDDVNLYTTEGLLINKNNIVKFSGLKNGIKLILL